MNKYTEKVRFMGASSNDGVLLNLESKDIDIELMIDTSTARMILVRMTPKEGHSIEPIKKFYSLFPKVGERAALNVTIKCIGNLISPTEDLNYLAESINPIRSKMSGFKPLLVSDTPRGLQSANTVTNETDTRYVGIKVTDPTKTKDVIKYVIDLLYFSEKSNLKLYWEDL